MTANWQTNRKTPQKQYFHGLDPISHDVPTVASGSPDSLLRWKWAAALGHNNIFTWLLMKRVDSQRPGGHAASRWQQPPFRGTTHWFSDEILMVLVCVFPFLASTERARRTGRWRDVFCFILRGDNTLYIYRLVDTTMKLNHVQNSCLVLLKFL